MCPLLLHDAILGYDFIKEHQLTIDGAAQTVKCAGSREVNLSGVAHTQEILIGSPEVVPPSSTFDYGENKPRPELRPRPHEESHEWLDGPDLGQRQTSHNKRFNEDGNQSGTNPSRKEALGPDQRRADLQTIEERGGDTSQEPPKHVDDTAPTAPRSPPTEWNADEIKIGPLEPEQKRAIWNLTKAHQNCFSWDGSLGHCTLLEHRIELTTDDPVRRPAYRTAQRDKEIIEREVREMLKKGVIEPSVSAYAAGVVLVPKPNNETRFCVDYRGGRRTARR